MRYRYKIWKVDAEYGRSTVELNIERMRIQKVYMERMQNMEGIDTEYGTYTVYEEYGRHKH